MTLLLDTQAFLWFVWNDPRLSTTARDLINEADHRKLVSIVSCREISIKASLGKLRPGEPAAEFPSREIPRESWPRQIGYCAGTGGACSPSVKRQIS